MIYRNQSFNSGNSVTVMSPEGKPIQVNAAALQSAVAQNTSGLLGSELLCKSTITLIWRVEL